DRNRSHWSTSKTPSYTKSVSWQHHLDADVMEWLKRPGKGYQTRLNAILREAMLRDQNKK
ncbi:BrnA antitoxin family protein, partial [Escherichia coli]|uniref:BrnA antitoxin family protein n=1 Tax=Escherichia coli TaxID=562 RepID=UPI002FFA92FB